MEKISMQEGSEKSTLTSGNYFEARKEWCLPTEGKSRQQMKAGFVEARRWRAPQEGGGQRPHWCCPDAPAVPRAGWEDREV